MTTILNALGGGLRRVLASPLLVAAAIVAMLLVTVPFALVVGSELQTALSNQPPIDLGASEIDPACSRNSTHHSGSISLAPRSIGG